MPHPHEVAATLAVHVVTVSTSRGPAEDRSGPLLRELSTAAGHQVVGHAIVADDPEAIGAELDRVLETPGIDVVLFTGGTGVSARDCTPATVSARFERPLPGFGELFRWVSYAEIGAAAMLSSATAGFAKGKVIFALPGSTNACRTAMEKLILPQLPHLAGELRKEAPLSRRTGELVRPVVRPRPAAEVAEPRAAKPASEALAAPLAQEPPRKGIDVVPIVAPAPEPTPGASGWQAAVAAVGGRLVPAGAAPIPEALSAIPAAMDVLTAANARMRLLAEDGRSWLLFGYPDLLRPTSKVLAVREALPVAEIVALHRWPARVGLCCEAEDSLLPTTEANVAEVSEARTGAPWPEDGHLFAVEGSAVWVQTRRYVRKWDGRKAGAEENVGPAIGSLLLHWSQR
jgi:molybdenum cofactor biosynthesis protein B